MVDYDATQNVLVYAKASWGYKAGGFNSSDCGQPFNPEYLAAYEAGVKATLAENMKLADDMGLNGTPSYVIGKQIVVGAVGLEGLKEKISTARCGKTSC